ncbi:hypothetical protein Dsin_006412 [Dipteronia sinensis]|uniref:RNase H type-1 domain-containing protein n=1 Tax=Dipteronia sinensis TaxID=43782 RepID=A0AAE0AZ77_9ROSI|nr:hypothetical protein Dsin_006412 [Dipteronia sinensis]
MRSGIDESRIWFIHMKKVIDDCYNARMTEIKAIYRGHIFSKDCGIVLCMIEFNAEVTVNWINDGSHLDSACGVVLEDMSLLISNLGVVSIKHVSRVANGVAHELAKLALTKDDDLFWLEDYPPSVCKTVMLDQQLYV